jgi:hypothetical protein
MKEFIDYKMNDSHQGDLWEYRTIFKRYLNECLLFQIFQK